MIIINTAKLDLDKKLKEIAGMELLAIDYAKRGKNFDAIMVEMESLTYEYLDESINGKKAPLDIRLSIQLFTNHLNK